MRAATGVRPPSGDGGTPAVGRRHEGQPRGDAGAAPVALQRRERGEEGVEQPAPGDVGELVPVALGVHGGADEQDDEARRRAEVAPEEGAAAAARHVERPPRRARDAPGDGGPHQQDDGGEVRGTALDGRVVKEDRPGEHHRVGADGEEGLPGLPPGPAPPRGDGRSRDGGGVGRRHEHGDGRGRRGIGRRLGRGRRGRERRGCEGEREQEGAVHGGSGRRKAAG